MKRSCIALALACALVALAGQARAVTVVGPGFAVSVPIYAEVPPPVYVGPPAYVAPPPVYVAPPPPVWPVPVYAPGPYPPPPLP